MSRRATKYGSLAILLFMALLGVFTIGCAEYSRARLSIIQIDIMEAAGEDIQIDDDRVRGANPRRFK